jgi:hypothetical protein
MFVSKGLLVWLVVSAIIVVFDAFYVINRPETMRGGKYFAFFQPYEIYIKFDTMYALNNDTFVVIQSWLNLVESGLLFIAVYLSVSNCLGKKLWGAILTILTSAMVFWKTVIFLIYDKDFITQDVKSLTTDAILYYIIPSSFWILGPLLTMILVSKKLVNHIKNGQKIK